MVHIGDKKYYSPTPKKSKIIEITDSASGQQKLENLYASAAQAVTDKRTDRQHRLLHIGVCLSVTRLNSAARAVCAGVIRCSLCQITLASCYAM